MDVQNVKNHRIGTITFGILLILFGCLFLLHIFIPSLDYGLIFRIWPCAFIFLGLEVLAGSVKTRQQEKKEGQSSVQFVYDKTAIFLMVCLSFFAMVMAAVDYSMQHLPYIY